MQTAEEFALAVKLFPFGVSHNRWMPAMKQMLQFRDGDVRRQSLEDAVEYIAEHGIPRTATEVDSYYARLGTATASNARQGG